MPTRRVQRPMTFWSKSCTEISSPCGSFSCAFKALSSFRMLIALGGSVSSSLIRSATVDSRGRTSDGHLRSKNIIGTTKPVSKTKPQILFQSVSNDQDFKHSSVAVVSAAKHKLHNPIPYTFQQASTVEWSSPVAAECTSTRCVAIVWKLLCLQCFAIMFSVLFAQDCLTLSLSLLLSTLSSCGIQQCSLALLISCASCV